MPSESEPFTLDDQVLERVCRDLEHSLEQLVSTLDSATQGTTDAAGGDAAEGDSADAKPAATLDSEEVDLEARAQLRGLESGFLVLRCSTHGLQEQAGETTAMTSAGRLHLEQLEELLEQAVHSLQERQREAVASAEPELESQFGVQTYFYTSLQQPVGVRERQGMLAWRRAIGPVCAELWIGRDGGCPRPDKPEDSRGS